MPVYWALHSMQCMMNSRLPPTETLTVSSGLPPIGLGGRLYVALPHQVQPPPVHRKGDLPGKEEALLSIPGRRPRPSRQREDTGGVGGDKGLFAGLLVEDVQVLIQWMLFEDLDHLLLHVHQRLGQFAGLDLFRGEGGFLKLLGLSVADGTRRKRMRRHRPEDHVPVDHHRAILLGALPVEPLALPDFLARLGVQAVQVKFLVAEEHLSRVVRGATEDRRPGLQRPLPRAVGEVQGVEGPSALADEDRSLRNQRRHGEAEQRIARELPSRFAAVCLHRIDDAVQRAHHDLAVGAGGGVQDRRTAGELPGLFAVGGAERVQVARFRAHEDLAGVGDRLRETGDALRDEAVLPRDLERRLNGVGRVPGALRVPL